MTASTCSRSIALALAAAVAACGGSSSSKPTTQAPTLATGRLIDAAVGGVQFASGGTTGTTEADGSFRYEVGQPVTFSLGGITFGSVAGKAIVTPADLVPGADPAAPETDPAVLKITQLLLMLDEDGDAANGIAVPPAAAAAAAGRSVDFATVSDAALVELVTSLAGAAPAFVSTTAALSHVRESVFGLYAGQWEGTYGHGDVVDGSFAITIAIDGKITGGYVDTAHGPGPFGGGVKANGRVVFEVGGLVLTGQLDLAEGSFEGIVSDGETTNWFRGTRAGAAAAVAPAFTPDEGSYATTVTVTLATLTSGASIRYTVDGSTPTATHGTVYAGPFEVGVTTTVRAVAYRSGVGTSAVVAATYTIGGGPGPGPGATCPTGTNPAPEVGAHNSSAAFPAATGGSIRDGTYYREDSTFFGRSLDTPQPTDRYQGVIVFSGSQFQAIEQHLGRPVSRVAGTWSVSGTSLTLHISCPAVTTETYPFDAGEGGVVMYDVDQQKNRVYTRQGPPTSL